VSSTREILWSRIYEVTRRRIITCELAPGTPLSEVGLAGEFGSSPTPVRDALGRLRQEGWVIPGAGRTYQVAPITLAGVWALAELRFVLEAGVVRIVIQRRSDVDLSEVRELVRIPELPAQAHSELIAYNRTFHLAVARLTGNAHVVGAVSRSLDESERLFHLGISALPVQDMEESHGAIVDALATKDMEQAVSLCEREAFGTARRVLQQFVQTATGEVEGNPIEPWLTVSAH
jgi:DNA-binding GntR family transcriptional regulator